jgi:hypothetical protein
MPRLAFRIASPALVAVSLFVAGCADEITGRPADRAALVPDNPPPAIDHQQLAYDPATRTVHFYELVTDPKTGRKGAWEVWLPERTVAYPRGQTFRLPRGVAESDVVIRASDPPGPSCEGVPLTAVPRRP